MGKRANAVALWKNGFQRRGAKPSVFPASRPMTPPETWRERAAPSPFVPPDVGAHPSEPKAERLRPLAGLASKDLGTFGDRTMTDIIAIALNKLDTDPMNVRKTYSTESIEGLAASILANGVIQNIVVRKAPKGRFFVTAGGRRRAALKLLAERDQIAVDHPVNALVKDVNEATEISLTENVMREDMHPVDQYEAFKVMVNAGKSVADVAARFGVTEIIVRRRLALAKVSPVLLDLFRNDEMDFEQLSAFTLSDDHERQEQVWNSLGSWSRHAHHIKSALVTDEVASSDKRIKLISGLDVYEQAGGAVRRDLFDENRGGYALDVSLIDRLAMERLDAEAEPFRSQGWGFVEVGFERADWIYNVPRVYPTEVELSAEEQSERLQLCAEHDALVEALDNETADDEANQRINAINARLDALDGMQEAFTEEDKARSGVVVVIGYYGKVETEAAAYAERAIKGSGWLPPMVRIEQDLGDEAAATVASEAFSVAAE
jgi:ParB family chromosome partitioning protein